MDLVHQSFVIRRKFPLRDHRFVTISKEPPPLTVADIKSPCHGVLQPLHAFHKVGFRRLDEQMIGVAHQHPRMHSPPRLFSGLRKRLQ